jgi:hypothetical protein
MATNANQYIVNIVPLQGIATGITSSSDTAGQISAIQSNVANIQAMVNYDTRTISADVITSFTTGKTIQITENINLSSVSLYSNDSIATFGTTSASTIQFTSLANNNSYISGSSNTMTFATAGNQVLKITPEGSLQYTSSSTYFSTGMNISGFLYVSESAYVKSLYQTSDRNQKTNILPFSTCLDNILKLEPCTFNWKSSGDPDIGFIAQDVEKSWPLLTGDGTSIAYSRFIPLLLEGLRELNGRVSTLEGLRN